MLYHEHYVLPEGVALTHRAIPSKDFKGSETVLEKSTVFLKAVYRHYLNSK